MAKKTSKEKKSSPRYVYTGHEEFPRINIKLTHQELEILFKHPPELMKLYMFLNLYRDFDTNITGENVHINDMSFKLWLGYPSKPGRKGWKPSTTHIVRWLEQLESLGLIQRRGNNVFYLPLAHTKNHESKISHQAVTNLSPNITQGVTNTNIAETSINIDENNTNKNEVSPNYSGGVTDLSQRLCTIPDNNLTKLYYTEPVNFLTTEENKFLNLFTDLKLNVKPAGDLKAITTAKALVQAGVSIETASEALKIKINGYHEKYQNKKTPHPAYFLDAILDYHRDLQTIKQQPEEKKTNGQFNRASKQSRTRPWETLHEQGLRALQESKVRPKRT